MLSTKLKEAAGNSADATLYVDDVFSTYLYTGNGSTQTITNGIDLAGKGGMTWIKSRSAATDHKLTDTARGATKALISDTTGAETTDTTGLTAFSSTGFSLGASSVYNTNAATYASWTFREAAKFFDVQTVSHTNGTANNIDLSVLGTVGMVIAKITSTTGDWTVWQRSLTASNNLKLNTTAAQSTTDAWLSVSGTTATLAAAAPTGTYVIYAYAHDTSSTGIIQCGSYTGTGVAGLAVNLGWEPQFLLVKKSSSTSDWFIFDVMRGMPVGGSDYILFPNDASAESNYNYLCPTATGFSVESTFGLNDSGSTYIYMAIRMPNKPPTTGTQVYNAIARSTNGSYNVGFSPDLLASKQRNNSSVGFIAPAFQDRLRGFPANNVLIPTSPSLYLSSASTGVESVSDFTNGPYGTIGVYQNAINTTVFYTTASETWVDWAFKRAPGFFDVVCYTGTGSATTQAHNLTVVPELMIVKERSAANDWWVYDAIDGNTKYSVLNSTAIPATSATAWNNTTPTASAFSIGTGANVNASTQTFVAYLFATLAGISKVGSYTGNGSSQNINCGFAAGARFFLVKATSTTGSWWVWDSARGITSGNDPALQLNSTAAEITTADAVDPYSPGITVNQEATCSINASGVPYIFLAIA